MNTQDLKAKYKKSEAQKLADKKYAKKVKATFIIVIALGLTAYLIWNVILGHPIAP